MTKYRIDCIDCIERIITGAYAGLFAKWHCAVLLWKVMTLPNALDEFRPNHLVLLVDRRAKSGLNVELCDSECDGTDDYDDSSEADDEQPVASTVI